MDKRAIYSIIQGSNQDIYAGDFLWPFVIKTHCLNGPISSYDI
jgi:hypothetical protein